MSSRDSLILKMEVISLPLPNYKLFGINTPDTRSSIIPHPPAYEDGTDREFRNVGCQRYTDAGDLPKRQQITIRTRQKFKIKNLLS